MKKSLLIKSILASEADPAFVRRAKLILENINPSNDQRILDLGCGRGFYSLSLSKLHPRAKIWGVDLNLKYLAIAKRNAKASGISFRWGDATKLNFQDNYFDFVIASEILEHITDDTFAMREILRVLRPGGVAMITVPSTSYPFFWDPLNWLLGRTFNTHVPSSIWWLAGIWADHVRLYKKEYLLRKLRKTGFSVEVSWVTTRYCLPFSHFLLYGIGKNLVEVGLLPDFNRFSNKSRQSLLNKVILWPFRVVDRLNKLKTDEEIGTNIIVKAIKRK